MNPSASSPIKGAAFVAFDTFAYVGGGMAAAPDYRESVFIFEAAWKAEWLGRRTRDIKCAGLIPDPGSQTVV